MLTIGVGFRLAAAQATNDVSPSVTKPWNYRCGRYCVYILCKMFHENITWQEVEEQVRITDHGTPLEELEKSFRSHGFNTLPIRLSPTQMKQLRDPAVAFLHSTDANPFPHFFVLVPLPDDKIQIIDYPYEPFVADRESLKNMGRGWQGDLLIVSHDTSLESKYGLTTKYQLPLFAAGLGILTCSYLSIKGVVKKRYSWVVACVCCVPIATLVGTPFVVDFTLSNKQTPAVLLNASSTELNLGVKKVSGRYSGEFVLTNSGSKILHIDRIISSCACLHVLKPTMTINANESVTLPVELNMDHVMPYSQELLLYLEEGATPILRLRVRGILEAPDGAILEK